MTVGMREKDQDIGTHGILVIRHHSDQRTPTFRVLPQQVEADLFDAARVWNREINVWNWRRRRTRGTTAADWRIKRLTAENNINT